MHEGDRFNTLDVQTHNKQIETFHGFLFVSSTRREERIHKHSTFNKSMQSFKTRLKNRGYSNEFLEKHLFEVNFKDRKRCLENKDKSTRKKILPLVTQYHPALANVKNILMGKWHLIQNQPHLKEIFQERPILSYRKENCVKVRVLVCFDIFKLKRHGIFDT